MKNPFDYKNLHEKCWTILNETEKIVLKFAEEISVEIYRIEYVAVFESLSDSIEIYIFYLNDNEINLYQDSGKTKQLEDFYIMTMNEFKYPFDIFPKVNFIFDSHENVLKHYKGNYFYRLR